MPTTLSAAVKAAVTWAFEDILDAGNTANSNGFSHTKALHSDDVDTADQVDLLYITAGTLAASASVNLDLGGGSDDSVFGTPIEMVRVKAIYVEHPATSAATQLTVGGGSSAMVNWISTGSASVKLPAGGVFLISAPTEDGFELTSPGADHLRVLNDDSNNEAAYRVCVIGCSE